MLLPSPRLPPVTTAGPDIPPLLAPHGERGCSFSDVAADLPSSTFDRPHHLVTGNAGDVFVCHPFLVHRATWPHRGTTPRIVAQPGIAIPEPFSLRRDGGLFPVERAILCGLHGLPV